MQGPPPKMARRPSRNAKHKIEVSVRVRPPSWNGPKNEGASSVAVRAEPSTSSLSVNATSHHFPDHVICGSDQSRCFDAAGARLLSKIQEGYSCCLMAYGQTGSGKTYSVFGPPGVLTKAELRRAQSAGHLVPDKWGIFPRVAIQLFSLPHVQSFQCSVVEVYQNRAFDLLDQHKVLSVGSTRSSGLDLGNGVFHASGCTCRTCHQIRHEQSLQPIHASPNPVLAQRQEVKSAEDVAKISRLVEVSRISKGHLLNARSSRSHCLVQIYLTLKHGDRVLEPTFLFVDLAGSERIKKSGVTGDASSEATRINSSLTILGRVIKALSDGVRHVPYRESTLTQLLQPVFANQAEAQHAEETTVSLRFAKRLTSVKMHEARVDGVDLAAKKKSVEDELRHAKAQLEVMAQKGLGGHFLPGADVTERRTFEENVSKLRAMETTVMKLKLQLREAESVEPSSAECRRLEERLLKAKNQLDIIDGVVMRQKTIPGLWAEPKLAYTTTEAQVKSLESMLKSIGG
ncbi:hypothetical protein ACHAXT_010082 [Thalassiosira profunda]